MKNLYFTLVLVAGHHTMGCSDDTVVGSGPITTRTLAVEDFTELELEGDFDVTFSQGNEIAVTATAQSNILDVIRTSVVEGRWLLGYTARNVDADAVRIEVVLPRIQRIESFGDSDLTFGAFTDQSSLAIRTEGSGKVAALAEWTGLEVLELIIAGSGDYSCFNLVTANASVRIEGSGEVEVTATSELSVDIEGSGIVRYKGMPLVIQNVEGVGQVVDAN